MISILFDALPYIIAALGAIGGIWGYGQVKKVEARTERALQDAKAANDTHERINHAPVSDGMHDNDIKRLLAERGKRNGGA